MAIMGFNPAAEMSQMRTQTLAMQASSSAAPAAAAATAAADPAAAAGAAAAAPGAAADAAIGAQAVQPPQTSKIVLQSVLKGALNGASVTLGLKSFGPMLFKVPLLAKFLAPAVGFISKLPVVGSLFKLAGHAGIQGFLIAGLIGAGVGAIFGAMSGLKKAKAAAAEYAEAMAAQQAQTPPATTPAAPAPTPEPAPAKAPAHAAPHTKVRRAKSWIITRHGSTSKPGGSTGTYTTRPGDTIDKLAERFHTSVAEMRKLNPELGASLVAGGSVAAGKTLTFKRKVIPDAKAWVA
jgi:hypothetical protein